VPADIKPQQELTLVIRRKDGSVKEVPVLCRIDTPIEVDYYQHGGILPYVLRDLMKARRRQARSYSSPLRKRGPASFGSVRQTSLGPRFRGDDVHE
jgi:hypothetical protein